MESTTTEVALHRPLYTFSDVDRLARVSRGTAKRWLLGYGQYPAISAPSTPSHAASFLDLVEVIAIGKLKQRGFPLLLIRQIVQYTQQLLKLERPLVSAQFRVGGKEIFVEAEDRLIEVGRQRGQTVWLEVLAPFLEDLDYTQDLASTWWPRGHGGYIQVSPHFGYGFPVIAGSGVRTEIIRERYVANDPIDVIAKDFRLEPISVEAALRFELQDSA